MGNVIKSLSKERWKTVNLLRRNGFSTSKTYSHSIVPTGFGVKSYSTRHTPGTSARIRPVIVWSTAQGISGTVAVIIGRDGSETVIRTSALTSGGVVVAVPDGAVVKLVDNSRDFYDTRDH